MEPANIITIQFILGLELVVLGHENDNKTEHTTGMVLMIIGWILNMIAIIMKNFGG